MRLCLQVKSLLVVPADLDETLRGRLKPVAVSVH